MNFTENIKKKVIIGEKYATKLQKPLKERGFECVLIPAHKNIEWQINSHADMLIFPAKENIFVCEPSIKVGFDAILGQTELKKGYPNNIAYNGLLVGKHFFHKLEKTDPKILKNLENVTLHDIKQGFAGCSTLVLGENLAITADEGVFNALCKAEIKTLLIENGHIDLLGYDYGFIGGSGFVMDDKTVCLTGKIDHHPNFIQILKFIQENNMQIDYLTEEKIFDVGSILPIYF